MNFFIYLISLVLIFGLVVYAEGTDITPCETFKEDLALDAEQIAYIMDCVKRTNNLGRTQIKDEIPHNFPYFPV